MNRKLLVEIISLVTLLAAVVFFCWVYIRLLTNPHDPEVPTHR